MNRRFFRNLILIAGGLGSAFTASGQDNDNDLNEGADMMNARRDQYVARIPLGWMGTAEEVAQTVVMVIGNAYMTGQTVQLNGGTHFI